MYARAAGVPAVSRSHVALTVAAALAGLVAGRVMPRGAPGHPPVAGAAPVAPPTTPAECRAERAQLTSTRAQLALCMAYRAPSTEPDAAAAAPEPPASTEPRGWMAWLAAEARKNHEEDERYPEAVYVRRADGTRAIYRPDEHSSESDDVYARKSMDGYVTYYLGPDAGPRLDPAAWGSLRDLADPDGWVVMNGRKLVRFGSPDAGSP